MYLVFVLAVSKDVAPLIEEELYSLARSGWEYEERDLEVIFKFYFPLNLEKKDLDLLEHLHSLSQKYDVARIELFLQPKEKWEEIWKYNFPPLKVGKRLLVLPPWEEREEEEGRIKVIIYPGQAFGTGHHATTQLMLENLDEFLEGKEDKPLRVLDMGCGSGILAIAVAKLCPKASILAVDIDELALSATYENAERNKVLSQVKIAKEVPEEERDKKFDLILANIGQKELKTLSPLFKELSKPGDTYLMLSGFFKEDAENIFRHYFQLGFKKVKSQFLREWGFLMLRL
ncbi:MAG: 50S ribosomal protein L11 methyltransferase [Thermodesulfobacterium sp.]|nr:50S ribosomal protein L11 methyltransferase [Thermodesulfobacterium sp.]